MYTWRERNSQCLHVGWEKAGVAREEWVMGGGMLRKAQQALERVCQVAWLREWRSLEKLDCE